jgi:hypothetical protein
VDASIFHPFARKKRCIVFEGLLSEEQLGIVRQHWESNYPDAKGKPSLKTLILWCFSCALATIRRENALDAEKKGGSDVPA